MDLLITRTCMGCGNPLPQDTSPALVIGRSMNLCDSCQAQQTTANVLVFTRTCMGCGNPLPQDTSPALVIGRSMDLCDSCQTQQITANVMITRSCLGCGDPLPQNASSVMVMGSGMNYCTSCQTFGISASGTALTGLFDSTLRFDTQSIDESSVEGEVSAEALEDVRTRLEEVEGQLEGGLRQKGLLEIEEQVEQIYDTVRAVLAALAGRQSHVPSQPMDFEDLQAIMDTWLPLYTYDREEAYRAELARYLHQYTDGVTQEAEGRLIDILVGKHFGIELKINPTQAEFDRLFGQIHRQLEKFSYLFVIIVRPSSAERLQRFTARIGKSLRKRVIVIAK